VEGRRPLRLAPIALKAFMRLQATALSGFGWFFGVPFHGRHGVLLQTVYWQGAVRRTLWLLRAQLSKTFMAVVRVFHVVGTTDRVTENLGYCSEEQNIVVMKHRVLQGT